MGDLAKMFGSIERRMGDPNLPTRPTEEEVRAQTAKRLTKEEQVAYLLDAFSMLPTPAEIPAAMGAAALRSKGQGGGSMGMLGAALLAGGIEALPFDEAIQASGLKQQIAKTYNKLVNSKPLQELTEKKLQKMISKVSSPEDAAKLMKKLGFPDDLLENVMKKDIIGNYKNKLQLVSNPEHLSLMSKKLNTPVDQLKEMPEKSLRENVANTIRGAKLGKIKDSNGIVVEQVQQSISEASLEGAFGRSAKNMTEEEIVNISSKVMSPDEAMEILKAAGLPEDVVNRTREDLAGNFQAIQEAMADPEIAERLKEAGKFKGPDEFIQRKVRTTLRGLKEGRFLGDSGRRMVEALGE